MIEWAIAGVDGVDKWISDETFIERTEPRPGFYEGGWPVFRQVTDWQKPHDFTQCDCYSCEGGDPSMCVACQVHGAWCDWFGESPRCRPARAGTDGTTDTTKAGSTTAGEGTK